MMKYSRLRYIFWTYRPKNMHTLSQLNLGWLHKRFMNRKHWINLPWCKGAFTHRSRVPYGELNSYLSHLVSLAVRARGSICEKPRKQQALMCNVWGLEDHVRLSILNSHRVFHITWKNITANAIDWLECAKHRANLSNIRISHGTVTVANIFIFNFHSFIFTPVVWTMYSYL